MRKTWKQTLALLLALLLALSLCACGSSDEGKEDPDISADAAGALKGQDEDTPEDGEEVDPVSQLVDPEDPANKVDAAGVVQMPDYHFALPKDVTVGEGVGDVDLMKGGKNIGGVWALDYPNAESLREDTGLMDGIMEVVDLVAPDNLSFEQSREDYGDFTIRFTQKKGNTIHTFFASGDFLYDVWVAEGAFSETELDALLSSFAVNDKEAKG